MVLVKMAAGAFYAYIFSPQAQDFVFRATAAHRNSTARTTAEKQNPDGSGKATAVFQAEKRNGPPSHFLTKAKDSKRSIQININYDPNAGGGQNIRAVIFLLFGAGFFAYQKITAATTHQSAAEEEPAEEETVPESSDPISAAAAVTFTCEICADEKPLSSFRILTCNHWYCSDCIGKYISSQLLENNASAIGCIAAGCGEPLDPPQFQSILPERVFMRWCDALCEASILEEDKFYCLFKDCSAFLIYDEELRKEIIAQAQCPVCKRCFCVTCKVQWHEGFTCEEFQKLRVDERSSEDLMLMNLAKEKKWKRCPQCQIFVERSEGCLFMRCRCGYTFCYNCGAPLIEHYCNNCKH